MKSRTPEPPDETLVIECHCQCPKWGQHREGDVAVVKADDCGHEFNVCVLCLQEGRIQDCRVCGGGFAE